MPHERTFGIGDHVYVSHHLGMALATGVITHLSAKRIIIGGKIKHIPEAAIAFTDGGNATYPVAWLTHLSEDNLDAPCPQCGGPNLKYSLDVVLDTPTGTSQISTLACTDCDFVVHPNV